MQELWAFLFTGFGGLFALISLAMVFGAVVLAWWHDVAVAMLDHALRSLRGRHMVTASTPPPFTLLAAAILPTLAHDQSSCVGACLQSRLAATNAKDQGPDRGANQERWHPSVPFKKHKTPRRAEPREGSRRCHLEQQQDKHSDEHDASAERARLD
jgi:hypothetical protein